MAAPLVCLCPVHQPEAGQRHSGQARTELFQRLPPSSGLGHALNQFIEFVVHNFPFVWLLSGGRIAGAASRLRAEELTRCKAILGRAAPVRRILALASEFFAPWPRLGAACEPQRGQHCARDANAEFLQRAAPGDGLGHSFGQFIELILHNFPFLLVLAVHGFGGEILISGGMTAPFTMSMLLSGVPSIG
jgi:hypothetical protein